MEQDVSAGRYKRNVLLLTPEDVTRRNGEVYTPNLGELSKLRRSEQFENGVEFADNMSAEDVKRKLEEAFPVLINKRFACAARKAQDSARLEFHGVRRIWDGRTIKRKLRGRSALYIVLEDELHQQQQQTSNSSLAVMQPALAVVDTENSPVPSNHPPIFPSSSSASVAPPQHSAALPVNSPQQSQLVHPQFTTQFPVQPGSSQLPTHQVQQHPFNPQLIENNSLLQGGSPMQLVPPDLPLSSLYGQFSLPQQCQQQAVEIPGVGASVYSQQLQFQPQCTTTWPSASVPMPTQPAQQGPLSNRQLFQNNPLQEPCGQGTCEQQDQLWVPTPWGDPSVEIVDAGQAKLSPIPLDVQVSDQEEFEEWIQNMDCDKLNFNQQELHGASRTDSILDFWNTPAVSVVTDQERCESYQPNQTPPTSNNNSSGISYGTSSSEENLCQDQELGQLTAVLEAGVTIQPDRAPLEGGGVFYLQFNIKLPDLVKSARAIFAKHQFGVAMVWKTYEGYSVMHGKKIPPGDAVGDVTVPIETEFHGQIMELGRVKFTYFDEEDEMMEKLVKNKRLQGRYFKWLGREFETQEKTSSNSDSSGTMERDGSKSGSPTQEKQHQTSVDILRKLVNTAARIGAEEFIQMVFSTSAGRIIFEAYKTESPLPEEIADSNGHAKVAQYLKGITERFSKEHGSCQTQSQTISWVELARAVEEREAHSGPSATDIRKPLETGTETETEYFGDTEDENPSFDLLEVAYDGDAENSASDSDNGKCDSVDEFKSVICKDTDSESEEEKNQEIDAFVEPKLPDDEGEPASRKTLLELATLSIEDAQSGPSHCQSGCSQKVMMEAKRPVESKDPCIVVDNTEFSDKELADKHSRAMQKCYDTEEKMAYSPFDRSFQDEIEALERKVVEQEEKHSRAMQKYHDTEEKVAYRPFRQIFPDTIEALERKVVDNTEFSDTELADKHSRAMQKCYDTEEKVAYRPFDRSFQDRIEALERKSLSLLPLQEELKKDLSALEMQILNLRARNEELIKDFRASEMQILNLRARNEELIKDFRASEMQVKRKSPWF